MSEDLLILVTRALSSKYRIERELGRGAWEPCSSG